jgi:hypothetical protein
MNGTSGPCVSSRRRARLALAALVCAAPVFAATAWQVAVAFADPPPLYVVFRADRTFFAYLGNGTPVGSTSGAPSVITAGTYKLILDDTSETDMDFDLSGPGVKLVTNMSHAEESSAAYLETFQPSSTYTFRDDSHPSVVWTFTTSSETLPASGTTTTTCSSCTKPGKTTGPTDVVGSQVAANRGALAATVSPVGKLALEYKGKAAGALKAGIYTVTVVDRSPKRGFTLQRARRPAVTLTKAPFVGRRTVKLALAAGQWTFFSPGGKKHYFIVVAR